MSAFFVSNYLLTWDRIGFSYILLIFTNVYIFTNIYIFVLHTYTYIYCILSLMSILLPSVYLNYFRKT